MKRPAYTAAKLPPLPTKMDSNSKNLHHAKLTNCPYAADTVTDQKGTIYQCVQREHGRKEVVEERGRIIQ